MTTVVVFDYGFGNVRSMLRAVAATGVQAVLTGDCLQASEADGLVVPGVGAFAECMKGLRNAGGDRVIYERIEKGRPVLGVCVGLQVMFNSGFEGGKECEGLGLAAGSVTELKADVVPHMGWNTVEAPENMRLFKGIENERFYFVHSYAVHDFGQEKPENAFELLPENKALAAMCEYGESRFVAAYENGALSATQFHPEKSAQAGAALLKNWIDGFPTL